MPCSPSIVSKNGGRNICGSHAPYLISDKPMTEEEWIRERPTVILGCKSLFGSSTGKSL
jgi:hypothetical protein